MEQRYAAAAVIYWGNNVLLARRVPTKHRFPAVLSLPSTDIRDSAGNYAHQHVGEQEQQRQLIDAFKNKIGLDIVIQAILGTKEGFQDSYYLRMTDYVGYVQGGRIALNKDDFSEARFVDIQKELQRKDRTKIDFCTQILLSKLDENNDLLKQYAKLKSGEGHT